MTDYVAQNLHNGDEVTVNENGRVVTVLYTYRDKWGNVKIQTTHNGFTEFYANEIS